MDHECEVKLRLTVEAKDEEHAQRVIGALMFELLSALPEPVRSRWSWAGPEAEPTCRGMGTPLPLAAQELADRHAELHEAILWAQAPRSGDDAWEVGVEPVEVSGEAGLRTLHEANFGALLEAQAAPGRFFSYID